MGLLELLPGVVSTAVAQDISTNPAVYVAGNRDSSNNVTIDGNPSNDMGNGYQMKLTVSQDAVSEVKVLTSNYQAEYGRLSGSNVIVATKSGAKFSLDRLSLADFGDVSHCDWFPPTMEEDLRPNDGEAFLHPVLDRRRYVSSMLHNRWSLGPGELDRALARFRREEYAKLIWPAARQVAVRRIQHKLLRWRHEMGL